MPAGGAWHKVTRTTDLLQGEMTSVETGGMQIAVYNVDDVFFATDDMCSHAHANLTEGWLDGYEIECPLHAARFDVRTGQVLSSPATCNLKTFPVRIDGGGVEIWIAGPLQE